MNISEEMTFRRGEDCFLPSLGRGRDDSVPGKRNSTCKGLVGVDHPLEEVKEDRPVGQKKKKAAGNANKEIGGGRGRGGITPCLIAQYKKFGLYSNCNRTMKTF